MSKLEWDKVGEKLYEAGVDRGVVYPMSNGAYTTGAAWNGLSGVDENPSGAESNAIYADNIKYADLVTAEQFGATITAYTFPDEFAACDGTAEPEDGIGITQQTRKTFGFTYRTKIGNDTDNDDYGYIIHLVYGAKATPSQKSRQTIGESTDAVEFSWELSTTPVAVSGTNPDTGKPYKPTAHLTINSTKVNATKLTEFEEILYGRNADQEHSITALEPSLPLPDDVIRHFHTT